jgi:RNA polymerase sigma-70 factor (ECF subfamily)
MCREDEAGVDLPAPDFESPFFAAARSEDAKRIAAALGALEPIYREALLLRFQEELSLAEIAQVARAPISTVSSRIHRGLSMLQAALGGGADAD